MQFKNTAANVILAHIFLLGSLSAAEITEYDLFGSSSEEEKSYGLSSSVEGLCELFGDDENVTPETYAVQNTAVQSVQEQIHEATRKAFEKHVAQDDLLRGAAKGHYGFTPEMAQSYLDDIAANQANLFHRKAWGVLERSVTQAGNVVFSGWCADRMREYFQDIADNLNHPHRYEAYEILFNAAREQKFGFSRESGKAFIEKVRDSATDNYTRESAIHHLYLARMNNNF